MNSVPAVSSWRRRVRRVACIVIALELVGVAVFVGALLVGERSRFTLIALYAPRHPLLIIAVLGTVLAPFTRGWRVVLPMQTVVCLILLFPVMGFTVSSSRNPATPIRLATYNVFFGSAGRRQLLDEVVAMPADIIVLQAAYSSMGEHLRERLPTRTMHQQDEFILLSRFPVRAIETPPPLPDGALAQFMKYVIDTPSGALRVYSVHPISPRHAIFDDDRTGKNIADREAQIAAAVTAARSDVGPFVILGDTNLPTLSKIGRRHLEGLKDAWTEAGFGFGFTFTAKRPWMRIDRAFGSDGIRFSDVRVGPLAASDHRALFIDLEIVP